MYLTTTTQEQFLNFFGHAAREQILLINSPVASDNSIWGRPQSIDIIALYHLLNLSMRLAISRMDMSQHAGGAKGIYKKRANTCLLAR